MINYIEKYQGVRGACASCKHIRSKEPGLQGDYVRYDGGKYGYCLNSSPIADIVMHDTPNMEAPVNECWESIAEEEKA